MLKRENKNQQKDQSLTIGESMKTKINSLTVVCNQGVNRFFVGEKYNNLLLDNIQDKSLEFENAIHFIYNGYTKDNTLVFEVINVPVEIMYCKE